MLVVFIDNGGRNRLRKDLSWTPHLFQLFPRWEELLSVA
jgi:hypothetical protein